MMGIILHFNQTETEIINQHDSLLLVIMFIYSVALDLMHKYFLRCVEGLATTFSKMFGIVRIKRYVTFRIVF